MGGTVAETAGLMGALRLGVFLSGGALAAMVQLAVLPSMTQMATHFSNEGSGALDSKSIAQLVMTIAAPAMAIGAPLAGWLAGLVGRRLILLVSALLFALTGAAGAVAPDLWSLFASRMLLGLAAGGFGTVAIAFIGDYPSDKRERLVAMYSFIGTAGALVELAVAGKMAEGGWRIPFALYLVGLLAFAIALPTVREPTKATVYAEEAGGGVLRPAYGYFVLIVALSILMYMVSVQGPFLLEANGVTSPSVQSLIVNVTTAGSMVTAYTFPYLRARLGFLVVMVMSWIALGAGSLGFGLAEGLTGLCIFSAIAGLGSGLMAPMTQTAILNVVSAEARPRALGLAFGFIFLAQFLQPLILAPVRAAIGINGTFVWVGAVGIAIGLLAALWGMRPARRPRVA